MNGFQEPRVLGKKCPITSKNWYSRFPKNISPHDGLVQNDNIDFWPQKCVDGVFQDSCTHMQFIAVNETFKYIWWGSLMDTTHIWGKYQIFGGEIWHFSTRPFWRVKALDFWPKTAKLAQKMASLVIMTKTYPKLPSGNP